MKISLCITHRTHIASFRIVSSMLAVTPLWLILATANTSARTQTADDVASSSTTSSSADWKEFHGNNTLRWNPDETVLGIDSVGGLLLKWNFATGSSHSVYESSSPVVVNGVVYFGSINGNVYALNTMTGKALWSYGTTGSIDATPAVANGVVYIGSGDYNFYALNAATGVKLWTYTTVSNVPSSAAVANGVVYFGSGHSMYALNANTGTFLWSYPTGGYVQSEPAVVNGVVYFGSYDGNVYALNASTGSLLWNYATANNVYSSPAVANGVVYFGSFDGNVYALNASTGALLWSYTTAASAVGNKIESSPAVANGVVYIGSEDGNVYALNASTGSLLWSYATGTFHSVDTSPAVANGVVYFGSDDGNQYALNASTGGKLWSYFTGDNFIGPSLTVVDGAVYGGSGVHFYAFGLGGADLYLRVIPSATTVHQGDLLTLAFPVWNLGPDVAEGEVLSNLQVPAGTTFDYVRISGTLGLGTCTHPHYGGTGQIICHEGDGMAPNTTWTVRLTVKVTAPAGTVITANAATMSDTLDPNLANNTATVSLTVQ